MKVRNLSMSNSAVLAFLICCILITDPPRVGVDVMRTTDAHQNGNISEFFRLMRRQFTTSEWEAIRGANDSLKADNGVEEKDQLRTFYRFWCLKESFVKAEGSGLGWDLQRLSFQVRNYWNYPLCSICKKYS